MLNVLSICVIAGLPVFHLLSGFMHMKNGVQHSIIGISQNTKKHDQQII